MLACSGRLDSASVSRLVDQMLVPGDETATEAVVDLRAIRFAEPYALALCASVIEERAAAGYSMTILCPPAESCGWYLARCGFISCIDAFSEVICAAQLREPVPEQPFGTVLPLQMLRRPEQIASISSAFESFLISGRSEAAIRPVISTLEELCANIFHHAAYPIGWFAGQRYWNNYQGREFVELAVVDTGQGIRRSLGKRFPELLGTADSLVLRRMLDQGLSSSSDPFRGNGYHVLQRAASQLDGSFTLRSGTGVIIQGRGTPQKQRDHLPSWPGTQLRVRFTLP
jgi:hypothetical protein